MDDQPTPPDVLEDAYAAAVGTLLQAAHDEVTAQILRGLSPELQAARTVLGDVPLRDLLTNAILRRFVDDREYMVGMTAKHLELAELKTKLALLRAGITEADE